MRFDAEQDPTRTDERQRDLLVDLLMMGYPLPQT